MPNYKRPLWLEEIVSNNTDLMMDRAACSGFIVVGNISTKSQKIRIAVLRDGPFLPVMTGASASILGMINALIKNDVEVVLIKCLRGNDNVNLYKKQKFPTIFIDEECFYGGKENILRKILTDFSVDIVHFDSAEAVNIQSKFIPRGIPKVFEVHNVEHELLKQNNVDNRIANYIKKQEKEACSIADAILFRSKENLKSFGKFGINNFKLKSSIYRGGINTNDISFDKRKFKNGGDILFMGHLNYEPNIQALRIIERFIAPHVKHSILVVGNYGESVRKEIVNKKIKFLGRVDDLNKVFRQCSVALAPLISGSGTRLKVLDYLASGLPVIGTRLSIEGLEPEIKEYIIMEDDFAKYPHHIQNLEKIYSIKKAVSARRYVLRNREWNNVIGDIIKVYKKLMQKG